MLQRTNACMGGKICDVIRMHANMYIEKVVSTYAMACDNMGGMMHAENATACECMQTCAINGWLSGLQYARGSFSTSGLQVWVGCGMGGLIAEVGCRYGWMEGMGGLIARYGWVDSKVLVDGWVEEALAFLFIAK